MTLDGDDTRTTLTRDVERLIERIGRRGPSLGDAAARDALLTRVARWQATASAPFGRLCAARGARFDGGPDGWPALPTEVFRYVRVATFPPEAAVRTFRTSGTTSGARGVHPFSDLGLYDLAARTAAATALFPTATGGGRDARSSRVLVMLAPPPDEAPDSSLSYMLGRFVEWFAEDVTWALDADLPVSERVERAVAATRGRPVALLGTSFALAALDEMLPTGRALSLGEGGLVMQTGGFKGRTRELEPAEMRARIAERFGVPPQAIVSEYGMTELASQLYAPGGSLADGLEAYDVPGWVRAQPVDPITLQPVRDGEVGILRIDDLANLGSVVSVQTADRARRLGDGRIVLLGRMPGATPRGCSLAMEEALEAGPHAGDRGSDS